MSVTGDTRTATSFSSSAVVPPAPTATIGPKTSSWVITDEHLHAFHHLLDGEASQRLPQRSEIRSCISVASALTTASALDAEPNPAHVGLVQRADRP